MKIKSLFDCLPPARELSPEPMPKKVPKLKRDNGKIVWGSRERIKCGS